MAALPAWPRAVLARAWDALAELERLTEPVTSETRAALQLRWAELPAHVKTPAQMIGRNTTGCEGTQGVFPRCNFACTPCYHSKDANHVRTDGAHTVREIEKQMGYMRAKRGPMQHAQLIGGEVSLLPAEDHAAALSTMRQHGRMPMSFTHGDFDYGYLEAVAVDKHGEARFPHLAFAGHFDSLMFGRRGIKKVKREADLHPYRRQFVAMFARLHAEHNITSYLAHNVTVTPRNLPQVAEIVRECKGMGWRMLSFQPAAFVGAKGRFKERYRDFTRDEVWAEIERGAGTRLSHSLLIFGDPRCNRTSWTLRVGERIVNVLDDAIPYHHTIRDLFLRHLEGVDFLGSSAALNAVKVMRAIPLTVWPRVLALFARWSTDFVREAGGVGAIAKHGVVPLTFVVHAFMDASQVKPAWEMLQRGEEASDPALREVQERLQACGYHMAHPDADIAVPACAQHSVYDPHTNAELRKQMPCTP